MALKSWRCYYLLEPLSASRAYWFHRSESPPPANPDLVMGYHPDDLISAARNIPSEAKWEVASWRLRNACEAAVLVKLGLVPARVIDEIARPTDYTLAAPHLTAELASWRKVCGLGRLAAHQREAKRSRYPLPRDYSECARILFDLGRTMLCHGEGLSSSPRHSIKSRGPGTVELVASWRPTNSGEGDWLAVNLDRIPASMVRRSWFSTPDQGPIIITTNGFMPRDQLEVWWGIHNGAHLDLLSELGHLSLREAEFGAGLLLSEAIAMSLEILAALETQAGKARYSLQVLGKGFIERADRLQWRDQQQRTGRGAVAEYWAAIPKVAEAYVVGPIRLIGSGFNLVGCDSLNLQPIARRFREISEHDEFARAFVKRTEEVFFQSCKRIAP